MNHAQAEQANKAASMRAALQDTSAYLRSEDRAASAQLLDRVADLPSDSLARLFEAVDHATTRVPA